MDPPLTLDPPLIRFLSLLSQGSFVDEFFLNLSLNRLALRSLFLLLTEACYHCSAKTFLVFYRIKNINKNNTKQESISRFTSDYLRPNLVQMNPKNLRMRTSSLIPQRNVPLGNVATKTIITFLGRLNR